MRARLGRRPVPCDGREHQDAAFGFRGGARHRPTAAGRRNSECLPAISDRRSEPRAASAEPVEVHIGASALPAIDRAGRLADGWIASPGLTCEEARAQADFYRQRCAVYGREPGAIVLRRDIYVGESSNEAQAVLQQALSRGYRGMPAEALIAGSVDEVAEQFRNFEEIGYTEILVRHLTNDQPKVLGSLERLAAVRAALA